MAITEYISMDSVMNRLDKDKLIPANKQYIVKHDLIISAKGLKESRRKRYVDVLRWWNHVIKKDFKKATKEDLIKAVDNLNQKSRLADSTKELYKAVLKTFYKWLEGNDEIFPEKIRWLSPKVHTASNKLPKDVFTEQEIETMLAKTDDVRDQAIIAMLYESGARADEFLSLKLADLQHEIQGVRIRLNGKTGERSILLVFSVPYISRYLNIHPAKDDQNSALWYARMNGRVKPLSYPGLQSIIRLIGERAGITKRMHAHNFRHSRATFLAQTWTEAQLCNYFGWSIGTKMVRKYVHLSGRDSDTAVLKLYGLAKKEDEISRLTPSMCKVCGFENAGKVSYCERCGRGMSLKAAAQERAIEDERLMGALEKIVDKDALKKELKQRIMKDLLKELKKEEILEVLKGV